MRLIDAEALIAEYDKIHEGEAGKARKLMEDAPTVEAIPIEFIKEKSKEYQSIAEACKDVANRRWWASRSNSLDWLISDWAERKEE